MTPQDEYSDIIEKIDRDYNVMKTMRPIPTSSVNRYITEFTVSSAHNSTAIEGNTFTYDETRLLLKDGVTSNVHSMREHDEIVGYRNAVNFLYKSLKNNIPIDETFIKNIHCEVLRHEPNIAGEYRIEQIYVGDTINIIYMPPKAHDVPQLMRKYIDDIQADMRQNSIIKNKDVASNWTELFHNLAKHHIEFERIHPFVDGNGRTGRLMLAYEMLSYGLLPVDIRYEEVESYYAALENYDAKVEYNTCPEIKTEKMANLLAVCELRSMQMWNKMFDAYSTVILKNTELDVYNTLSDIIHNKRSETSAEGLQLVRNDTVYTILAYDAKNKNCLFETENNEYIIAKVFPSPQGDLKWSQEISFGKGQENLLKALAAVPNFACKAKNILE